MYSCLPSTRLTRFARSPHRSKSANANNAYSHLFLSSSPVIERRIHGDSSAQERCCRLDRKGRGYLDDEVLVASVGARVTTKSVSRLVPRNPPVLVHVSAVGPGHAGVAVLLIVIIARWAVEARVNVAANPNNVANFELGHFFADGHNFAKQLVTSNERVPALKLLVV